MFHDRIKHINESTETNQLTTMSKRKQDTTSIIDLPKYDEQFYQHQNEVSSQKKLLYIGGLSHDIASEQDIYNLCQPFGLVLNVIMPLDVATHKHRGFAFVEFKHADDARHAMNNLHRSLLYNRTLTVNYARPMSIRLYGHADAVNNNDNDNDNNNINNDITDEQHNNNDDNTVTIESALKHLEQQDDITKMLQQTVHDV